MLNVKAMAVHLERLRAKHALLQSGGPHAAGDLCSFYTRILPRLTDSERCSVFIYDPEKQSAWSKVGGEIQVSEGSVVGQVIAAGRPIAAYELEARPGAHKEVDATTGSVTKSSLAVPITSSNRKEITGAIEIINKRGGKFTQEDIALAEEMAAHLQREVEMAFLEQEVFGLSQGLYSAARKATAWLLASVGVAAALATLTLAAWALLPLILE